MLELKDIKNGDVISFNTTNHELLGSPELVTVSAFCDYNIAVMLDTSLPSTINRVISDGGLEQYDPNTRNYMVYKGTSGVRAIDITWVVEKSLTMPYSTTMKLTIHNVTISNKALLLQALSNLSINYTVE